MNPKNNLNKMKELYGISKLLALLPPSLLLASSSTSFVHGITRNTYKSTSSLQISIKILRPKIKSGNEIQKLE
jgi:hypothetical protein